MEAATSRAARGRWSPAGGGALNRLRSDRGLAERYRAGDDGAFALLHERHTARLRAIAMAVLGSAEDAEDAVQEAFASAATALRVSTPREMSPWLARVTRNAAIDLARARRPSVPVDAEMARPDDGAPPAQLKAELAELLVSLQALPERQRSALVMRELAGLSYVEIGEALDSDEAAVRGLIARARVSLRSERAARELTCGAVRDLVAAADDGRRRPSPVRRHLRGCRDCRQFASGIRADSKALRGLLPGAGLGVVALLAGAGLTRPVLVGGLVAKGAFATQVVAVCAVCAVGAEGVREVVHVAAAPGRAAATAGGSKAAHGAATRSAAASTTGNDAPAPAVANGAGGVSSPLRSTGSAPATPRSLDASPRSGRSGSRTVDPVSGLVPGAVPRTVPHGPPVDDDPHPSSREPRGSRDGTDGHGGRSASPAVGEGHGSGRWSDRSGSGRDRSGLRDRASRHASAPAAAAEPSDAPHPATSVTGSGEESSSTGSGGSGSGSTASPEPTEAASGEGSGGSGSGSGSETDG